MRGEIGGQRNGERGAREKLEREQEEKERERLERGSRGGEHSSDPSSRHKRGSHHNTLGTRRKHDNVYLSLELEGSRGPGDTDV